MSPLKQIVFFQWALAFLTIVQSEQTVISRHLLLFAEGAQLGAHASLALTQPFVMALQFRTKRLLVAGALLLKILRMQELIAEIRLAD